MKARFARVSVVVHASNARGEMYNKHRARDESHHFLHNFFCFLQNKRSTIEPVVILEQSCQLE